MLEFKPVTIDLKEEAERYLKVRNTRMCEYCFTDLFIWAGHYGTKICFQDELMFVMAGRGDTPPYYLAPIGREILHMDFL